MIEQTVNIGGAARGAVYLGDVKIFVEGDVDRDAGESHDFSQGNLHDDDIHEGQAVEFPVFAVFPDDVTYFRSVLQRGTEEFSCKFVVFVAGVLWQKGLVGAGLLVEALDGFQHE